jgi:hypothetical protein
MMETIYSTCKCEKRERILILKKNIIQASINFNFFSPTNVNPNFILGVFSNIKLFFFLISSFLFSDEKIKNMFIKYFFQKKGIHQDYNYFPIKNHNRNI